MESSNSNIVCLQHLPTQIWLGDEQLYQWNGYWFRFPQLQGTQQVINHYKPLPSDVILASFPKTGTTWLKSLVYSIINRSSKGSITTNHPHELTPTLEIQLFAYQGQASNSTLANVNCSTRNFSTHVPYQLLAETVNSSDCRVVYITRNPKDTLISLWQFALKSKKYEPWPLEVAVEKFYSGVVPFGSYFDHVLGYCKENLERRQKVFFLTFEELKDDPKTHVKRLAKFLGSSFEGSDEQEEEIVRNCSFERLSNYEVNKSSDFPTWLKMPYKSFFRQGEVGDHKNYLNEEMIESVDAITVDKFHGAGFVYGL